MEVLISNTSNIKNIDNISNARNNNNTRYTRNSSNILNNLRRLGLEISLKLMGSELVTQNLTAPVEAYLSIALLFRVADKES